MCKGESLKSSIAVVVVGSCSFPFWIPARVWREERMGEEREEGRGRGRMARWSSRKRKEEEGSTPKKGGKGR